MFFRSENWATKITARMGLHARSPEAKVLSRLILWSEKQTDQILRAMGKPSLPKERAALEAAVAMARNATAVAEVGRVLRIDLDEAAKFLRRCRDAASYLALDADFVDIVMTAARDRSADPENRDAEIEGLTTQAEVERMFMTSVGLVSNMSVVDRAAVAYGVALSWNAFNANFKSMDDFKHLSVREREAFLDSLQNIQVELEKRGDRHAGFGVSLTVMFLCAVPEFDAAGINRMSDQLEPLNREGFALLVR